MKIVNVIPISRTMGKETLTYFTAKEIVVGDFVSVPVRKKTIIAVVTSVHEAQDAKTALKDASYGLKKITEVHDSGFLSPAFVRAALRAASYFATSTGAIIDTLTPQAVITNYLEAPEKSAHHEITKSPTQQQTVSHEKLLFQADEEDRIASYKSLIREYFAKKESVVICLPTLQDIERISPALLRGIEEYAFVLHSGLSKKELLKTWKHSLAEKHPVLIISTGTFLSLPRYDIGAIIIERENSNSYKTRKRPFIDMRTFAEFLAEEMGAPLIYGDILLRVETLARRDHGTVAEFAPLKFRALSSATQGLIEMKNHTNAYGEKKFTVISDDVVTRIKQAQENSESFFLLTSRRGLYPLTLCGDCGEAVRCDTCGAPLVLHGREDVSHDPDEKNIFICHTCGEKTRSKDRCRGCGSWRLATLGIGSERVEEVVAKLFPHATVLRLDKDTTSKKKKAHEIIKTFYEKPNTILVGTEMAVPYLYSPLPNTAIISIDSLFTIPDFKIYERVVAMLLQLRSRTTRYFGIQTRLTDTSLFQNVLNGNLLTFYREEITNRRQFNYPPFSVLIKITRRGKPEAVAKDMAYLSSHLAEYQPMIFPAGDDGATTIQTHHALIRIKADTWPDSNLQERLAKLPPSFTIKVDPEHIL